MGCGCGVVLTLVLYFYLFARLFFDGSGTPAMGFLTQESLTVVSIVALVVGALFGYLAIKFQKVVIVLITSLTGSFLILSALLSSFFAVSGFPTLDVFFGNNTNTTTTTICHSPRHRIRHVATTTTTLRYYVIPHATHLVAT